MTLLFETPSRSIPITKQMVWDAYRKVKSNKGSAGVDEDTLIDFDADLSKNLYKLWKCARCHRTSTYPCSRLWLGYRYGYQKLL